MSLLSAAALRSRGGKPSELPYGIAAVGEACRQEILEHLAEGRLTLLSVHLTKIASLIFEKAPRSIVSAFMQIM